MCESECKDIINECINHKEICQFDNCKRTTDGSTSSLSLNSAKSGKLWLDRTWARPGWSFENWSWIVNMGRPDSAVGGQRVVSCLNFMVMNIWIVSEYCPPPEWGRGEYDGTKIGAGAHYTSSDSHMSQYSLGWFFLLEMRSWSFRS